MAFGLRSQDAVKRVWTPPGLAVQECRREVPVSYVDIGGAENAA